MGLDDLNLSAYLNIVYLFVLFILFWQKYLRLAFVTKPYIIL